MMGARGPSPKPTKLKLLQGNPGRRPLNQHEPEVPPCVPAKPEGMDEIASAEWDYLTGELAALGIIGRIDKRMLKCCCLAASRLERAEAELVQGLTYATDSGQIKKHPAAGIAHEAMQEIKAFYTEFGLSPASRTRVQVEKPVTQQVMRRKRG